MAAPDPQDYVELLDAGAIERAVIAGLRERGYVVIEPDRARSTAYVAVSTELLVELAARESEPVVMLGLVPDENGGYSMTMRRPSRAELQATIMARFQSARERKARG